MPYIKDIKRPLLDAVVETMADAGITADGDLNYLLFAFFKRHFLPDYHVCKNFCGELRQCATEIERRLLAPYEDEKIKLNGDVL